MILAKILALVVYASCLAHGGQCVIDLEGRVTEYLPWMGTPMQCAPPCDMTAYMVPVEYGVTAACNGLPWNTRVVFFTSWHERVERYCQDVCPGCEEFPQGLHIDVAAPEDNHGRYYSSRPGGWPIVVEIPEREQGKQEEVSWRQVHDLHKEPN